MVEFKMAILCIQQIESFCFDPQSLVKKIFLKEDVRFISIFALYMIK